MDMQKRKEMVEEYKKLKTYMGVIQLKNNVNGKVYLHSFPNMKNRWPYIKLQLDTGRHPNAELQKDWKTMGEEAFTFEVLEEQETEDVVDVRWELKQMEKAWLQKLEPYGQKGYNKPPKD